MTNIRVKYICKEMIPGSRYRTFLMKKGGNVKWKANNYGQDCRLSWSHVCPSENPPELTMKILPNIVQSLENFPPSTEFHRSG